MTIVQRGNELYALTDDIQVSAFLSCGWVLYTPPAVKENVKEDVKAEPEVETVSEPETEAAAEVKDDGLDGMSLKELRAIAKEKGINSFQKGADVLREEIRSYDSGDNN